MNREDIVILFSIQNYLIALKELAKNLKIYSDSILTITNEKTQYLERKHQNKQKLIDLQIEIDNLELELTTIEQELINLKTKQIDANPDIYIKLQSAIVNCEQKKFVLEDNLLQKLMILDAERIKVHDENEKLKTNIEKLENNHKQITSFIANIKQEEIAIKNKISSLESLIADQTLLRNFQLLSQKTLPVIIECDKHTLSVCKGCHVKISGDLQQQVNNENCEMITCDNCGRMMYFSPDL